MLNPSKSLVTVALAALSFFSLAPQKAEAYQVDCAILLCLAGGWPASAECSHARAVFIRRITPFPVEPPLQIWRCPMGASYEIERHPRDTIRFFDALYHEDANPQRQSFAEIDHASVASLTDAVRRHGDDATGHVPPDFALRLVQDRADIDISGPEFNFVRSIRVFDVRYAWQRESPRDGDCYRSAAVFLGTYGTQGDFSWRRSSTSGLPSTHEGLDQWEDRCPSIYHRSVFVDWRDYEGNYGFEQVNY